MISYEEALNIILKEGARKRLPDEMVEIEEIAGRICAADIAAPVANQPFDNSAMDGFALRVEDLAQAANDSPVVLEMIGHIAAGDSTPFKSPGQGQCYEIMTGALLPPGCDAVVPVEKIEKGAGKKILFRVMPGKGENIRRAGEDFQAGDRVFQKGKILDTGHILALATLGIGKVNVLKKPRIGLISTGREVVDEWSKKLEPGQIFNSTRPYLAASLKGLGAEVKYAGTIPDDPALFRKKLSGMIENGVDVGISTGAVSAGVHDFVPAVLKEMGAEILFHKVAIRPGKPILFARFPGGLCFFGLPGNPVSSAAGLRFFVRPLIRALQGLPPEEPHYAILRNSWHGGAGKNLRIFVRVKTEFDRKNHEASIPGTQQSFMVRPFTDTNGWCMISENKTALQAGDLITVYADQ